MDKPAVTPDQAPYQEWSRVELIACILSAIAYFAITAAVGLVLLNQWLGWVLLVIGLASAWAMYRVIDPKLKLVSAVYEQKQQGYLEELDRIIAWKQSNDQEGSGK